MQYCKEMRLEVSGCGCPRRIFAKQMDRASRFLKILLLQDGRPFPVPESAVARLSARKPDGNYVLNDWEISDGWIFGELTEQILAVPGEVRAEIQLYDGEALLTSVPFSICVRGSVITGDELESTYECSALLHALETIETSVEAAQSALEQAELAEEKIARLDELLSDCAQAAAQAEEAAAECESFLQQDVPALISESLESLYGQPGGIPQLDENGELPLPTAEDIGAADRDHTHNAATSSAAGFLSAADKQKLDGIAAGATNVTGSGWKTLTVASSFVPYNANIVPRYQKFGPVVCLVGELKPASANIAINSATSVLAGELPAGYRPAQRARQICHGSSNYKFLLTVDTNGKVYINRYGSTNAYASGITGNECLSFNTVFMTA